MPSIVFPKAFLDLKCFDNLSFSQKSMLSANAKVHNFKKNQVIFEAKEESSDIFFVMNGAVKNFMSSDDKEHIVGITSQGEIFGECCLFGAISRQVSSIVLSEKACVVSVSFDLVKSLMQENFQFNLDILKMIGEKVFQKEERLRFFATKDARERIVKFLQENALSLGRKVGLEMLLKHDLTQQDIASFTGTSRQTVTTVLNDLKNQNKIFMQRKSILIRDVAALC